MKKYLTGILPFFSWLDTDPWQLRAHHCWTDPPEVVRSVVREYLVSKLQCRLKPHQQGGEWLETNEEAVNPVRLLLSGLKLFYRTAQAHGYYQHDNPLSGSFTEVAEVAREHLMRDDDGSIRPHMPDQSGVDAPRSPGRLTDSYFLLKEKWIPQVVTDTELPQKILNGGRMLKKQGKVWGLREECMIVLLFETGARVSELMSLTLGDWNRRGLKDTAWARNKGSRKRRAKYVRFSEQTVKLLKKYFDTERKEADAYHYTLDDYLRLAEQRQVDLDAIPVFLSLRDVICAPKTWGDPLSSMLMDSPQNIQAVVGYVLRNLLGCPWKDHLVLLAAVLYSQNIQYVSIESYLSTLHSGFQELFAAFDLQSMTEWAVDTHLTQYLSGQVLGTHTASPRTRFWKKYQSASRHLKRWLAQLPTAQQERYRPYLLPYPADPYELTRLSGERHVTYNRQERRKEDTDAIMPFFADLRTQAHLRYNLVSRLRQAYHKAIKAVEQGKATLPFEFEMREGGNKQSNRPSTERLVFKLWDRRTFVLEHADDTPPCFSQTTIQQAQSRKGTFSLERNSYLLEFVRAESLDRTSPAMGLWFLELLEHDVLGKITEGSREVVAAKQAWLREQGYGEDEEGITQPFKFRLQECFSAQKRQGTATL